MDAAGQLPGLGWSSVALSFASLGIVCLVAWGALRLLAGRGVGKASGAVRVVARCPLEPRRSVYVVEAAGRCFLIGVGDGPMAVLAELDADRLKADVQAAVPSVHFADVLARALGRRGKVEATTSEPSARGPLTGPEPVAPAVSAPAEHV
jgi:flagellar biosynthetic protein FliO